MTKFRGWLDRLMYRAMGYTAALQALLAHGELGLDELALLLAMAGAGLVRRLRTLTRRFA